MKALYQYFIRVARSYIQFLPNYLSFLHDYRKFAALNVKDKRFSLQFFQQYPCVFDKTESTPFEPHYLYHPAWAARVLQKTKPKKHIDIASTVTFCSIVSAFVPVDFYDIRPANIKLSGLQTKKGDLMALPFASNSVESISCMHTIEHVGLGRYGDPLDPSGDKKAINELIRVTKKGGSILFVTPVGKRTIRYNAHRIYAYEDVMTYFEGCELKECTLIPDSIFSTGPIKNPKPSIVNSQNWGCGCFWFLKK